jgi:hypothetical protein
MKSPQTMKRKLLRSAQCILGLLAFVIEPVRAQTAPETTTHSALSETTGEASVVSGYVHDLV